MAYKRIVVDSLGEYMDAVAELSEEEMGGDRGPMYPQTLWFRGQNNFRYSLIPSLFRTKVRINGDTEGGCYTNQHYAEDIRTQHYIAKNYHLLSKVPSSRVEWLEVMQHHQVKTRVLDWSESSMHSLLFAIEAFLDGRKYHQRDRKECSPCVWVLCPKRLNKSIIRKLKEDRMLQENLLEDIDISDEDKKKIFDQIDRYGKAEAFWETSETSHIDYIFNLSSINDEILRDRSRLKKLLISGNVMTPYYYLLSRVYSDGYTLTNRELPPLCVVHPYHSERIRVQRGVFTVFPFYRERPEDSALRVLEINPDAMENNELANACLCQIMINSPQKIALQMLENGMNDSWLYPEMPVVSSEIEERKIY